MTLRQQGFSFLARTSAASAAMTASQHLEMLVTQRPPSDVPVRVVEQLIRRDIPAGLPRTVVGHLAQGSLAASAVIVGRLTRRMPALPATALNALSLVVGDAALASALGLGGMPWTWRPKDLVVDVLNKTALALTATALSR